MTARAEYVALIKQSFLFVDRATILTMKEGTPLEQKPVVESGDDAAAAFLQEHCQSRASDVGVRLVLAGNEIQKRFDAMNKEGERISRDTMREGKALSLVMKTIADQREAAARLAELREQYPQSAAIVESILEKAA